MTDQHPITPPPELVAQIRRDALHRADGQNDYDLKMIYAAYQAGADQELEACYEWLLNSAVDGAKTLEPHIAADPETFINAFRAARRPKPPSLAEEALKQLSGIRTAFKAAWGGDLVDEPIRRALERLQELEEQAND
jgi:hypothetical protein